MAKESGAIGYTMCNPVIRRMRRESAEVTYREAGTATYEGIMGKTTYFLLLVVLGAVASLMLHTILLNGSGSLAEMVEFTDDSGIFDVRISALEAIVMLAAGLISLLAPLFAWLIRPAIPVVGTLYSLSEGYFIGMITQCLGQDYKWISFLAMLLTVALVGTMLFLYAKRIVTVTEKAKTMITTVFLSIIIGSVLTLVFWLIPLTRPFVTSMIRFMDTPLIGIAMCILYLIIAALFLLVDFDTIEECVEEGVSDRYEWMAAWGLAYTVIYIYFKILNLILRIAEAANKK